MTTKVFYGTTTTLSAISTNIQYRHGYYSHAVVDSTARKALPSASRSPSPSTTIRLRDCHYTPFTDPFRQHCLARHPDHGSQSSGFYTANFAGGHQLLPERCLLDVNVSIPDFSLAANFPTLSNHAGNSATATITVPRKQFL